MGLINEYNDKFGAIHKEAYFMIESYRFNKDTEDFNFQVKIYHSKDAKDNKKEMIEITGYDIRQSDSDYLGGYDNLINNLDTKGVKVREYLYTQLKNTAEFKGSVDE